MISLLISSSALSSSRINTSSTERIAFLGRRWTILILPDPAAALRSRGSVPDSIPIGSRPLPRMRRKTVDFVGSRHPSSTKNERVRGRFRRFVLDAGELPCWSRGSVARVVAGRRRCRRRSDRRERPRRIRGRPCPCQESERRIRRKTVLRIGDPRAGKGQVIGIVVGRGAGKPAFVRRLLGYARTRGRRSFFCGMSAFPYRTMDAAG